MKSLKTAVKIWKKEIEFKLTTWGVKEEERVSFRKRRQEQIKDTKLLIARDLLNRDRIGDIILTPEDRALIQNLRALPVFRVVEGIYRKYL
jgi:hypothetical protein